MADKEKSSSDLDDVDSDAEDLLAAIPADYDGDFMIEVDEPSVESKRESHRMSFEWARNALR